MQPDELRVRVHAQHAFTLSVAWESKPVWTAHVLRIMVVKIAPRGGAYE